MSTALTTQSNETLATLLRQPNYANRFKEVLGERAGQFVSSVLSIGATMKDVDPNSIISSAMIAASLDLPINKNLGFAWIVPYNDKGRKVAQFQMGYKGFIQLALRTGQYSRMNVRGVNVEAFGGYDDVGEPMIDWSKIDESKESVGYVFAWKLINGFTKVCYWTKAEVESHAQRYSQSYRGKYESPWKTHFDAMAKKTVVKNELSRWGVLSIQFHEAMAVDQAVDAGDGLEYPDNQPEPVRKPPLEKVMKAADEAGVYDRQLTSEPEPSWEEATKDIPKITVEQPAASPPVDLKAEGLPTETVPPDSYATLTHILETKSVSFDDFKDWLENSGRLKNAKLLNTMDELPPAFAATLAADTAAMAKCIRLYGKPTQKP